MKESACTKINIEFKGTLVISNFEKHSFLTENAIRLSPFSMLKISTIHNMTAPLPHYLS